MSKGLGFEIESEPWLIFDLEEGLTVAIRITLAAAIGDGDDEKEVRVGQQAICIAAGRFRGLAAKPAQNIVQTYSRPTPRANADSIYKIANGKRISLKMDVHALVRTDGTDEAGAPIFQAQGGVQIRTLPS